MADEAKIKVTTPGAKAAERDLKRIADAERKVGREAEGAGRKGKKGADESREAMDSLGRSVGINLAALANWKMAAATIAVGFIAGISKAIKHMQNFRREMREGYREFVEMTRQANTVQLAQIRGKTEAETALWKVRTGGEYSIDPSKAGKAAFEFESGLKPEAVGGQKALDEIEAAGFKFIRATSATGEAAAGLALAGYQAGIADRPEEFKALYAKVYKSTQGARVDPGAVAQVLSRLLPLAVTNGIDPNYFIAMTCAMSFSISEPGKLASTMERLIRAAGKKGPALEKYAEQMGREASDLSAVEVMEFHGRILAEAAKRGGPQAVAIIAEQLGIAAEEGTSYAVAFNPMVQATMREIMGGTASWKDVEERYQKTRGQPESKAYSAKLGMKADEYEGSREHWLMTTLEDEAKGRVKKMMAEGKDIPGVSESWSDKGPARAERRLLAQELIAILTDIEQREDLTAGERETARDYAKEIRVSKMGKYQRYGLHEGYVQEAAQFAQSYHGGTHYHQNDKTDPAGKPLPPRGQ